MQLCCKKKPIVSRTGQVGYGSCTHKVLSVWAFANGHNARERGESADRMIVVLMYLVANVAMSTMLERSRKGVAVVSHALMFLFTFVLLLFFADIPMIAEPLENFLGTINYRKLINAVALNDVSVLIPFAIVEVIVVLQMLFSLLFVAVEAVGYVFGKKRKDYDKVDDGQESVSLPDVVISQKFYYLFSVLRC